MASLWRKKLNLSREAVGIFYSSSPKEQDIISNQVIYIYIYIYICVCVCVCVFSLMLSSENISGRRSSYSMRLELTRKNLNLSRDAVGVFYSSSPKEQDIILNQALYIYIYIYIYHCLFILKCVLMSIYIYIYKYRGSIAGRVVPKIKKKVLDAALLNNQHCKVPIKGNWSNPEKQIVLFSTHRCNSYWKGSHGVTLDNSRPTYLFICICAFGENIHIHSKVNIYIYR